MSQWTHVNASIRFDSLLGDGKPTVRELGIINSYYNPYEFSIIPSGSEGSIEYTIVDTGSENALAANVVVFSGDLRDYENEQEILRYFKRIVKNKTIRSGILEIDIETKDTILYRYRFNKGWVEIYRTTEL